MKILWLKTELLHPLDKGGRIRTYQMLRALSRHHEVTYLTLDDSKADDPARELASEYCAELVRVPFRTCRKHSWSMYKELAENLMSPLPYALWKYRSESFRRELLRLTANDRFELVVCDFLAPAVNVPPQLPQRTVLFQHNVEAEIWRRHAEVASNPLTRMYVRSQWRRMAAFEEAACRRFHRVVAVSEKDREHFERAYGVANAVAVPTGVDTEYFRSTGKRRDPLHLVFTGSMDWMPNEDAVSYFVEQVLPRVRQVLPETIFTVVGRNPGPRVRALASGDPRIRVTGTVPDVRPYLEKGAAFVVPLRVGSGTRLKIFEAMAMDCPVVSTTVGAEGLPLREGEHLLLGDTPEDMAAACVQLLRNPASAARLGRDGGEYVRRNFGWEQVANRFAEICTEVPHRPRQRSTHVARVESVGAEAGRL